MFVIGQSLFLLIPSETNERILLQGKVLENDAENVVAEFAEPITLAVGADVNLYADFRGRFYQQGASFIALRQSAPAPADVAAPAAPATSAPAATILAFRKVGEIVSADNRGSYRVSTATLNLHATIAKEQACRIVDISPEGFAAITGIDYAVGSLVNASFTCEGLTCTGPARVQTLKTLPNGLRRYGFLAADAKSSPMRKSLGQLTSAVQRIQLRRLSRTG